MAGFPEAPGFKNLSKDMKNTALTSDSIDASPISSRRNLSEEQQVAVKVE